MQVTYQGARELLTQGAKIRMMHNGKPLRLILDKYSAIWALAPNKRAQGYQVDWEGEKEVKVEKTKEPADEKLRMYRLIEKYRKLGMDSDMDNTFIDSCKALPKTFAEWEQTGFKKPYQFGITTGCRIDGKIISLDTMLKGAHQSLEAYVRQQIAHKQPFVDSATGRDHEYIYYLEGRLEKDGRFIVNYNQKVGRTTHTYLMIDGLRFIGYDIDY